MAPLHPDLAPLVAHVRTNPAPHPSESTIEERRAAHAAASALTETAATPMAAIHELELPGGDGPLAARWYVPEHDDGAAVAVYFHGGGFVMGTLDSYDGLARHLADVARMPLFSVAYRLAPEHRFPAATDDALAATTYVASNLAEWGYDGRRVILMGDSAGATLAAVTAQSLRHTDLLAGQVLLYPTLGPELVTESAHTLGTGYVLELSHLHANYEEYLGEFRNHSDPRVTPLLSGDLDGCAPAVIVVAEYDPLRDEAVAYAGLLEHSQVHVDLLEAEGMIHSFFKLGGFVADVADELAILGDHIRALLS